MHHRPGGDGFHVLRHHFASLLIQGGCSVKEVQERLGHTSAKMTLDVYSHLWSSDEDRTRTVVDRALADRFRSARSHTVRAQRA